MDHKQFKLLKQEVFQLETELKGIAMDMSTYDIESNSELYMRGIEITDRLSEIQGELNQALKKRMH